jgi:hypothetical protein
MCFDELRIDFRYFLGRYCRVFPALGLAAHQSRIFAESLDRPFRRDNLIAKAGQAFA